MKSNPVTPLQDVSSKAMYQKYGEVYQETQAYKKLTKKSKMNSIKSNRVRQHA